MDLNSIIDLLLSGGGILLLIMTIIQITPIKINPWSSIARSIGRAVNKEIIEKVDELNRKVTVLERKEDERNATLCRTHILRFGDEILHGVPHSKEHYDNILVDVNTYEEYCDTHPDYRNNIAIATIKHIKRKYEEHLEKNDFL